MSDALHNPWRVSLENCISGDNYLRASEYRDLIKELDDLYRLRAALSQQAAPAPQAEPVATVGDLIIQVRERVTARGILNSAPLYAAAPAVAAPVQPLTDALRMIAWSNDSAWQAQCAREALAAAGITATPAKE